MITGKILGEKYVRNGIVSDLTGFVPDMSAEIYYEVVRLIDGGYLFLEDHLERLRNSLEGSGISYPGSGTILENLRLLQLYNPYTEGNIRICLQMKNTGGPDILVYFIPYFYPEPCMYKSGVQLAAFPHVRPNPGIKKWDDHFRSSVNEFIRDRGVYEAVLLNDLQQVTEGSRSNIFFLDQQDQLVTPPVKDILPGITRRNVLMLCGEAKISIMERDIPYSELDRMTSCFISGTSPKVLPVWQLDGFQFKVDHPLLLYLMERFEALLSQNLTRLI